MFFPVCAIDLTPLVELEPSNEYAPRAGESIDEACKRVCARVVVEGRPWAMVFNDRRVIARPGDMPRDVFERWCAGRL